MPVLRQLDLVALALAFPVFLVAGLPLAGYGLAAGAWLLQKVLQVLFAARVERRREDPKAVVGYLAGGAIARGWTVAIILLAGGLLTSDEAGLSAAVTVIALFSVYFATKALERLNERLEGAGQSR